MILAEKIAQLRKMSGMSQEELAEKLQVSRQSISKWESAQSVPDLKRILDMAEHFGVSTDTLLKDEMELAVGGEPAESGSAGEALPALRQISMEEANSFLSLKTVSAGRIALGVMLCILSPIALIMLSAAAETGMLGLSETQAAGIGLTALILLIGCAVALFITCGMKMQQWEFIEKEPIETAYGVSGIVKERMEKHRPKNARDIAVGVVLCVISCLPIFIGLILELPDFFMACAVGLLLAVVSIGVLLIVHTSIISSAMQALLEEGEFSRAQKEENRRNESVMGIYWITATLIYLAVSFLTKRWDMTWIIWPIAGVGCALLAAILKVLRAKQ